MELDNKDIPACLAFIHFPSLDLPRFPKKLITGQEVGKEKLNRGEERGIHLQLLERISFLLSILTVETARKEEK